MRKQLGIVGLGKMGEGLALNLLEHGWEVVGYNRSPEPIKKLEKKGLIGAYAVEELVGKLEKPRLIWLMVPAFVKASAGSPANSPVDEVLFDKQSGLINFLEEDDVVIDGGNSFFKNTEERAARLAKAGIKFMDAGVSGGPLGARNGACMMIGGDRALFNEYEQLFSDLTVEYGYGWFGESGAGHFVKMVHNGIEYGMMQAIAEGFSVMKESKFKPDLREIAGVYNHGSVIESRLIGWLEKAYEEYGVELKDISGKVSHSGEGKWTVETAEEMKLEVQVIKDAFEFRIKSQENSSTYTGKVVSALRGQFGGHEVDEKK